MRYVSVFLQVAAACALLCPRCGLGGFALVVADARRDALYLLADQNDSGRIEAEEVAVLYDDSAPGVDLSTPADLCLVDGALFLLDGGTLDAVLTFSDADGDGVFAGEDESWFFHGEPCPGPSFRTPHALAYAGETFFVADDSKVNPLIALLFDHDGDGLACSGDESLLWYSAAHCGVPEAPHDPESLCPLGETSCLVGDGTNGVVYLLTDANGDGEVAGAEEIRLWYQEPPERQPARFSALVCLEDAFLVADQAKGAVRVLKDGNADGSVDPEETHLFYSSEAAGPVVAVVVDLQVDTQDRVYLVDNGTDQILLLEDRNGNGTAMDPGEAFVLLASDRFLSQPTSVAVLREPQGDPPGVEGLDPQRGDPAGGTTVTITGEGFRAVTEVYFGQNAALSVAVLDGQTLSAVTPAGTGTVDLTVATIYGTVTVPGAYQYEGQTLHVERYEPTEGPSEGGFPVTFFGSGLSEATVFFDGRQASVVTASSDTLAVLAPPHEPGDVTVTVTDGHTEVTLPFTYRAGVSFVRGDVDGDSQIAINDAILILSELFAGKTPPACRDRSDVNDDGTVNIADAVRLLSYLFAGAEAPPAPFPEPGVDPTSDDLPCNGPLQ